MLTLLSLKTPSCKLLTLSYIPQQLLSLSNEYINIESKADYHVQVLKYTHS
jgi:hypothetical protein